MTNYIDQYLTSESRYFKRHPLRLTNLSFHISGVLLAAIMGGVFGRAIYLNFFGLCLDSAYMVELIDSTFQKGIPLTHLTKSVIDAIRTVLPAQPETIITMPLPLDDGV